MNRAQNYENIVKRRQMPRLHLVLKKDSEKKERFLDNATSGVLETWFAKRNTSLIIPNRSMLKCFDHLGHRFFRIVVEIPPRTVPDCRPSQSFYFFSLVLETGRICCDCGHFFQYKISNALNYSMNNTTSTLKPYLSGKLCAANIPWMTMSGTW